MAKPRQILPVALALAGAIVLSHAVPGQTSDSSTVSTLPLSRDLPSQGRLGGVATDRHGNVYVSNFREAVWRITPDGDVRTLASDLRGSSGNAVAPDGSLLQASFLDGRLVRIARDGTAETLATGLDGPVGIAVARDGTAYVCNCRGNSISQVTPDGAVSTFAEGEPLACPNGITFDEHGDLIVASFNHGTLARIGADGTITPWVELPDGGNAHVARIGADLYVTKIAANLIYRVTSDRGIARIAGTGVIGFEDGPALSATLSRPNGIATTADSTALIVNTLDGKWRGDEPTHIVLRRLSVGRQTDTIRMRTIRIGELAFDARVAGPEDGELVLLLHGFPQTGHAFRHQLRALARAGYFAVAPDQRGYSPGARPAGIEPYRMGHLVSDVAAIATALGRERFHLVGHDWGGAVAWVTATRFPARVFTLTVLSTPHFAAFGASLADSTSDQARRSSYFSTFAAPGAEQRFLADDRAFFRRLFDGSGIPPRDVAVYLERLGTPDAMRAALNWYSALVSAPQSPSPPDSAANTPVQSAPSPIDVPTLYVWSTEDPAFGREAAEKTAHFVRGPYRFHVLEGRGHWLAEEAPETVTRLLLEHLKQVEGER